MYRGLGSVFFGVFVKPTFVAATIVVSQIAAHAITFTCSCLCQMLNLLCWINSIVILSRQLYHHCMQPVNDRRFVAQNDTKNTPALTKEKIRLLEKANCLSGKEKVRLLALLAGKRWLTEVDIRKDGTDHNRTVTALLDDLGLAWVGQHYIKKDGTKVEWVEVGANRAVIEYIAVNKKNLSVLEAGILYGYPVTAVLAGSGILSEKRKRVPDKTPAESCLGGIFSENYEKNETRFLEEHWQALRRISPKLISEAENKSR